ncbi:MAG: YHYH protein, partial [Bacteroidota bacterium]
NSVSDSTATEAGEDGEFTITLAKTNDTGATLSIPYTVSGTATDGTDYTSLAGSVDIADGESSATIAIAVTDDSEDDDDETVVLTLDTDNFPTGISGGSTTSATITITDDDFATTASITASDDTGTEGSDDGEFTISLAKTNDTGSGITIPYTVSGTATNGTDYASLSGSVTISSGQSQATITVDITDDTDAEGDETVILTLDDGNFPSSITAGTSTEASVNILDDDAASPTLTFGTATGNTITINSWTDVGADGYVIYMSRANNISDITDGDDPVESTTYGHNAAQPIYDGTTISGFTITLLEESKTYYFRVFPYSGSRDYDVSYGSQSSATITCETSSTTESQVCYTRSSGTLTVTSNQLPDHSTGTFPNADVTAISLSAAIDATPAQVSDTTYVYNETGGPTPSNQNFWRFGVAINGLGYNPMGLKPYTNPSTGEENWEWQQKVTETGETDVDNVGGHVTSQGQYHYHGDMTAMAANEDGTKHSLIYGYAADGFPIYYKYVFSDPNDLTSAIQEMDSSWQLRSGSRPGDGTDAPDGTYDGTYIQDFEYVEGLGDLDECNGRWGKTPEYPDGTYYYVITAEFPVIPNCFTGDPSTDFRIGN